MTTLAQQIACVRRELAMRANVYPKWISAGRMRKSEADYETDAMQAVLATLLELQRKEAPARGDET